MSALGRECIISFMIHKKLWKYWLKFGRILGRINTTVILSIIYYIAVTPTGLIKKIFTKKNDSDSYWIDIPEQKHSLEDNYQQY